MLVDELGIEPADELRELEQAILRQDESLRAPPGSSAPRPTVAMPAPSARPSRKVVTVLVSSVVDPDGELGRLDPELLRAVLDRYLAAVAGRPSSGTGARRARSRTTTLVAVFGVPAVHEDDALRAVRAAVDMRQAIADLNDELVAERGVFLQTRTGIDTGEVLVTEDPVPTGRPIAASRRLARRRPRRADRARRADAGRSCATRSRPRSSTGAATRSASSRSFPGRTVARLRLDAPLVGTGAAAPGARERIRGRGRRTVVPPLHGARRRGRRQVAPRPGARREPRRRRRACCAAAACRTARASRTCRCSRRCPTRSPPISSRPIPASACTRGSARRWRSLARERPLVLVLDDLHWAEPAFLDLVEDVASTSRDAPLLMVCLARPELLEHRPAFGGGMPNSSSLLLEPLGGRATRSDSSTSMVAAPIIARRRN